MDYKVCDFKTSEEMYDAISVAVAYGKDFIAYGKVDGVQFSISVLKNSRYLSIIKKSKNGKISLEILGCDKNDVPTLSESYRQVDGVEFVDFKRIPNVLVTIA